MGVVVRAPPAKENELSGDSLHVGPHATGGGASTRLREQKRRGMTKREVVPRYHVDSGRFPHFSHTNGLCMCLLGCCLGPAGCKCPRCPCDKEGGKSYGLHSGKIQLPGEFSNGTSQARPQYSRQ